MNPLVYTAGFLIYMLSWSEMQTQFQDLADDSSDDALTFAKTNMRIGQEKLEAELNLNVIEQTLTGSTSASTNVIQLPNNFIKLISFYVTVGDVQYRALEEHDEEVWRMLVANTASPKSNYVTRCFVRRTTLEIYPRPSSVNTWTMLFEGFTKPLNNDDYTTGTITTLTNGAAAVTASGSTFIEAMEGRFFKIDADGEWYEISSVDTTTTLTLANNYKGTSIAAGTSTYTIGEMPRTPGATHHIPVHYALWQWFAGVKGDTKKGRYWESLYLGESAWAKSTFGNRFSSQYIRNNRYLKTAVRMVNPNWYPKDVT